mmetsp:Transcript_24311/g.65745  ORF Transcript_24311/g.65745 Transcript_24311/m.65745 type:complete len:202 (+) Transcript_24311:223-828(+)
MPCPCFLCVVRMAHVGQGWGQGLITSPTASPPSVDREERRVRLVVVVDLGVGKGKLAHERHLDCVEQVLDRLAARVLGGRLAVEIVVGLYHEHHLQRLLLEIGREKLGVDPQHRRRRGLEVRDVGRLAKQVESVYPRQVLELIPPLGQRLEGVELGPHRLGDHHRLVVRAVLHRLHVEMQDSRGELGAHVRHVELGGMVVV